MVLKKCKKKSDSTPPFVKKNYFYSYIISGIRNGLNLSEIAKKLNLSRQRLNYYVSPLKKANVISKVSMGVWAIKNEDNLQHVGVKKSTPVGNGPHPLFVKKPIRGHGFVFTVKLSKIKNWENRESYLKSRKISYKSIPQGQSIDIIHNGTKFTVWLCRRSLVVYFPKGLSYFAKTAKGSYLHAFSQLSEVIRMLGSSLNVNLRVKGKLEVKSKCFRQHYAEINNELAVQCNSEEEKFEIRDDHGKLWLLIDKSFNQNELETVHGVTAQVDMDRVAAPFFNSLREHYTATGESITINSILKGLSELQKIQSNQTEFNKSLNDLVQNFALEIVQLKEARR
jgi:hypothetical protein